MFLKAIPTLPAIHIRTTIEFYEKKLGFTPFNYGNYAVLTFGEAELHIYQSDDKFICEHTSCFIRVKNIEDLYTNLSLKGITDPHHPLEDKPGGMKEFAIRDNNGNQIRFGEKK